ncbi:MAG: hypothetical protein NVSMB47_15870 [Polyangiales bacterium]
MNTRILATFALVAAALASSGCAASTEPTTSTKTSTTEVAQKSEALDSTRAPLFTFYEPATHELDVQTCDVPHPADQTGIHPCTTIFADRHIVLVVALILDASGRVIGDSIVADRPGGGCIHVSVPSAVEGGSIRIVALARGMVAGSPRTSVYFLNQSTST